MEQYSVEYPLLYPVPVEVFLPAGHLRPPIPPQCYSAKPVSFIKQSSNACQARHEPFPGCKGFILLIFH
jgi:hypothetical protein